MSVTIPDEMADALAYWSRDALFSLGGSDETVTCVEIKPMADGSGHWAVFAYTYDRDRAEHSYRTVVDVAGELVSVGDAGECAVRLGRPDGQVRLSPVDERDRRDRWPTPAP